jgi:hypothetical protein
VKPKVVTAIGFSKAKLRRFCQYLEVILDNRGAFLLFCVMHTSVHTTKTTKDSSHPPKLNYSGTSDVICEKSALIPERALACSRLTLSQQVVKDIFIINNHFNKPHRFSNTQHLTIQNERNKRYKCYQRRIELGRTISLKNSTIRAIDHIRRKNPFASHIRIIS